MLFQCRGNVIVSGMGKAGLIGQKIMATLASTGTPSHCLHPAEAVHGDLGRVHADDVVLMLSQSGETEEIVRLLPSLAELGRADRGHHRPGRQHAGPGGHGGHRTRARWKRPARWAWPPARSTTAMLAVGDALALVVSRMRDFGREDFARFHPAGSLGHKLSKVEQHMRPLEQCRVAPDDADRPRGAGRRQRAGPADRGHDAGRRRRASLSGIFTDSDLARLFEQPPRPRVSTARSAT